MTECVDPEVELAEDSVSVLFIKTIIKTNQSNNILVMRGIISCNYIPGRK